MLAIGMRELELQLPDDLYARLVRAAEDQDLTVEDFAEEALSQAVGLEDEEIEEDYYDPDNDADDWDEDEDDDPSFDDD